jgi:hypothetical protein
MADFTSVPPGCCCKHIYQKSVWWVRHFIGQADLLNDASLCKAVFVDKNVLLDEGAVRKKSVSGMFGRKMLVVFAS